ncbi:MAG TPA: type II CAAX endopeptidase family protein [Blastocatellia bacterium]|nr:type II CAAX endopeptidase family protein [Blastocatellia bacterium]
MGQHENRAKIALAIYIATFVIVWTLRATVFISIDEGIESSTWRNVYSNAVKFAIWVVPAFITLRLWHLPPFNYLKLTTSVNKRGLIVAAMVVGAWLGFVLVAEAALSGRNAGAILLQRSDYLRVLAGVFVSPIWEETLFRGFFLNRLNESLSFWKSNLISAALFVLAHVPYWVSKNGLSPNVMRDLANVFLLGCLFGWVMKKTNSLWPAIGAHIANNFLSGLIHS